MEFINSRFKRLRWVLLMLKHGCMPCSCLRVGGDSRHLCSHIAYTHPEAPCREIFPKYRPKKRHFWYLRSLSSTGFQHFTPTGCCQHKLISFNTANAECFAATSSSRKDTAISCCQLSAPEVQCNLLKEKYRFCGLIFDVITMKETEKWFCEHFKPWRRAFRL